MADLIIEARELCEKVTGKKWNVCEWESYTGDIEYAIDTDNFQEPGICSDVNNANDAAFIARSRTLVPELANALEKADTELAQLREAHTCEWTEIDAESGHWQCSKCGVEWYMSDGDVIENDMRFCPRCGKEIIAENRDMWSEEKGKYYERIPLPAPPANGGGKE